MKKIFLILLSIMFFVVSCGNNNKSEQNASENNEPEPQNNVAVTEDDDGTATTETGKSLVIYFSHTGTTEKVAKFIQNGTNADIFVIQPQNSYPTDYNAMLEVAKKEFEKNEKPAVKQSKIENLNDYNTIYVGFPIWNGRMPMIVQNVLSQNDFSGKNIVPFATYGSTGFKDSLNDLRNVAKNANIIENGFGASTQEVNSNELGNKVNEWLKTVNN